MTEKKTPNTAVSLAGAIRRAHSLGQEDEALEPIVKAGPDGRPRGRLQSGDSVIFYDLRGEREIELTRSLTAGTFSHFRRKKGLNLNFVTMIEYDPSLKVRVAFPPEGKLKNTLTEVLCRSGRRVAKIAESEKAVHIGYFMNGKADARFPGEDRFIVPSPQGVSSYAQTPEMNAAAVVAEVSRKIEDISYPIVMVNLANVDVVGHIEDKSAVLRAIEAVDTALGRIAEECRKHQTTFLIVSDHGTVEEWLYPEGAINTGHTSNPVPFILADFSVGTGKSARLSESGELADVAPTLLHLAGLAAPPEMTGRSLVAPSPGRKRERRKVVLLILDGWGLRKDSYGNLIREARTPNFDRLWSNFPHARLRASGEAVGMPARAVGNSEAGHLHIGAGRRVLLDRVRIDRSIEGGDFFGNPAFLWAMELARKNGTALHLMGIISHYSSHGTLRHLFALLRMAEEQRIKTLYIHGFIGRRGEMPESGAVYVEKVEEMTRELKIGEIVTVIGRHWALDREENWDRIEKTYRALVYGEGTSVSNSRKHA
jgi:2,3-bisphosphoglycerate-independent phosphoglycerate mutase